MSERTARPTTAPAPAARRRGPGRPRSGEREQRRRHVLQAALAELAEHGYGRVTMLGVATRAGASKETLYRWFGNRDGLFAALIEANADASVERIQQALRTGDDPRGVLVDYATGLLHLLTHDNSIALNRAAMSSPELAEVLRTRGRERVSPIVADYLRRLADDGVLDIDDAGDAFRLLYGLVVRDTQIAALLGGERPDDAAIRDHAATAVDRFLRLTAATDVRDARDGAGPPR